MASKPHCVAGVALPAKPPVEIISAKLSNCREKLMISVLRPSYDVCSTNQDVHRVHMTVLYKGHSALTLYDVRKTLSFID